MEPIQHLMLAELRAEPRDVPGPMDGRPRIALLTRIVSLLPGRQAPMPAPLADCA